MRPDDSAWQAFRVSLLSPLITGEIPHEEREAYFQSTARKTYHGPGGKKKTISVRTLRRWYQRYCEAGIEGLKAKRRSDLGQPQERNRAKVDRAEAHKRQLATRSDITINKLLQREFSSGLASSTLYRHLRLRGATKTQLGIRREKVRCRWTRDTPNSLWMGDFSHGPLALIDDKPRQTYLSIWIDAHSRFLVEARYYPRENFDCLTDSLLRAWAKHGASRELYADNGKIYHAHGLTLACGKLQIRKLHRPPREPQPGGLVERVFQTIGSQFASEVKASTQTYTLQDLNQALRAYVDTTYNHNLHSETGQAPHDRYFTENRLVRHVAIDSVQSYFLEWVVRRVDPTHSDVRIDHRFYKVDLRWRGLKVYVQYDPFRIDSSKDEVHLFNEQEVFLGIGTRYERERGAHGDSKPLQQVFPPRSPVIDAYLAEQQKRLAQSQQGIDYQSALRPGELTLPGLANLLCKYLGRPGGGLSAFQTREQMALGSLHQKYPQVRLAHVQEAARQAEGQGFVTLLWHLESLLEGEPQ